MRTKNAIVFLIALGIPLFYSCGSKYFHLYTAEPSTSRYHYMRLSCFLESDSLVLTISYPEGIDPNDYVSLFVYSKQENMFKQSLAGITHRPNLASLNINGDVVQLHFDNGDTVISDVIGITRLKDFDSAKSYCEAVGLSLE